MNPREETVFQVSIDEAADGRVRLTLAGDPARVFSFTPSQARALASELIQAVYKAEVRQSLARRGRTASFASSCRIEPGEALS